MRGLGSSQTETPERKALGSWLTVPCLPQATDGSGSSWTGPDREALGQADPWLLAMAADSWAM